MSEKVNNRNFSSRHKKRKQLSQCKLPSIPADKKYFSISEVSRLCGVKAYVLRYWEKEFSQLKPIKRQDNRRYYERKDIEMVRKIKKLLYEEGLTIEGARSHFSALSSPTQPGIKRNVLVKKMIAELESVLQDLYSE